MSGTAEMWCLSYELWKQLVVDVMCVVIILSAEVIRNLEHMLLSFQTQINKLTLISKICFSVNFSFVSVLADHDLNWGHIICF